MKRRQILTITRKKAALDFNIRPAAWVDSSYPFLGFISANCYEGSLAMFTFALIHNLPPLPPRVKRGGLVMFVVNLFRQSHGAESLRPSN